MPLSLLRRGDEGSDDRDVDASRAPFSFSRNLGALAMMASSELELLPDSGEVPLAERSRFSLASLSRASCAVAGDGVAVGRLGLCEPWRSDNVSQWLWSGADDDGDEVSRLAVIPGLGGGGDWRSGCVSSAITASAVAEPSPVPIPSSVALGLEGYTKLQFTWLTKCCSIGGCVGVWRARKRRRRVLLSPQGLWVGGPRLLRTPQPIPCRALMRGRRCVKSSSGLWTTPPGSGLGFWGCEVPSDGDHVENGLAGTTQDVNIIAGDPRRSERACAGGGTGEASSGRKGKA